MKRRGRVSGKRKERIFFEISHIGRGFANDMDYAPRRFEVTSLPAASSLVGNYSPLQAAENAWFRLCIIRPTNWTVWKASGGSGDAAEEKP